jgi:site-specific DNA recombinase
MAAILLLAPLVRARDRTAPERRQILSGGRSCASLEEGVALLDLARNAQRLFDKQEPREKRRLLNFVLSNCTWEDGEVIATFRQPFDMLAETVMSAARIGANDTPKSSKSEIWLGDLDSNQD